MKRVFLLSLLLAVGCGGGDGGDVVTEGPTGTETGYKGLTSGPDGEIVRMGYEAADGSQEQGFPADGASGGCQADDCVSYCRCLGQPRSVCESECGQTDNPPGNDNGNGNGNGNGNSDQCAGITDPCTLCACQNIENPTVCVDTCLNSAQ